MPTLTVYKKWSELFSWLAEEVSKITNNFLFRVQGSDTQTHMQYVFAFALMFLFCLPKTYHFTAQPE